MQFTRQEHQQTPTAYMAVESALNLYSRDRKKEIEEKNRVLDRDTQLAPADHIESLRGGF